VHDDATLVALSMTSARHVGPDSPSWRPPATPGDVVRRLGTGEEVTHPTAATVTPVTGAGSSYVVRAYRAGDDAAGTHAAFREAVLRTASSDYDAEQIAAWAGSADVDLARWDARRAAAHTFVAVVGGEVAGFVDFLDDGLVDMLFVHPDHGRTGVARALVQTVQREARSAGLSTLRTHASRTARPAFERLGFRTVKERPHNVVGGRVVPNYEMRYDLHDR
jgi:putative acetyltransferase